MKTTFEKQAQKNKALSTLGYGLMWFFTFILIGILPFFTGNANYIFYIIGGLALSASIFQTVKGIKQLKAAQLL